MSCIWIWLEHLFNLQLLSIDLQSSKLDRYYNFLQYFKHSQLLLTILKISHIFWDYVSLFWYTVIITDIFLIVKAFICLFCFLYVFISLLKGTIWNALCFFDLTFKVICDICLEYLLSIPFVISLSVLCIFYIS